MKSTQTSERNKMVSGVMDMLEQEFQVLTAIEQGKIIGGSGGTGSGGGGMGSGGVVDELLSNQFITDGLTETQLGTLRYTLDNMATTSVGMSLLNRIASSGKLFDITDNNASGNAFAEYETEPDNPMVQGKFDLGKILNSGGAGAVGYNEMSLGHELFHAYENINSISMQTTNAEADAYAYQNIFMNQYLDGVNAQAAAITITSGPNISSADSGFANAMDNIVNGDYSMDNYDNLQMYFGSGSTVGSNYDGEGWTSTAPSSGPGTIIGFLSGE